MRTKPKSKAGKRSLYNPTLGSSNHRKAEERRFANPPAFIACKNIAGVSQKIRQKLTGHVSAETNAIYAHHELAPCVRQWKSFQRLGLSETTGRRHSAVVRRDGFLETQMKK